MKIKIIKKNAINSSEKKTSFIKSAEKKIQNTEKKLEKNIMGWISDLQKKKNLEFIQARNLLGSY